GFPWTLSGLFCCRGGAGVVAPIFPWWVGEGATGAGVKWESVRPGAGVKWESVRPGAGVKWERVRPGAGVKWERVRPGAGVKW
ncbi:hypothetical protein ACFVGV_05945, partial [Pseudarthrobacter scleromae]|uniref:hypothetical protein n=1 Tax=Pseudarthrobacter scleromae TaxID=158897 RepID=UPI00362A9110